MAKTGPTVRPAVERFWNRVVKTEGGCWLYSNRPDRYGQMFDDSGKNITAHRFSYRLHKGDIPRGAVICHTCDVRGCVNPSHLYAGTHEDNTRDIVERKRHARNNARRVKLGDARRYRFGRALDSAQRGALRAEYATGEFTQAELAKRWRLSQSTVSAIVRGVQNCGQGVNPKKRTGFFRRKLAPETAQQIRELYFSGQYTQVALAERFGIHQTYVSALLRR